MQKMGQCSLVDENESGFIEFGYELIGDPYLDGSAFPCLFNDIPYSYSMDKTEEGKGRILEMVMLPGHIWGLWPGQR